MIATEIVDVSGSFTLAEEFLVGYSNTDSADYLDLFNAIRDAVSDAHTAVSVLVRFHA